MTWQGENRSNQDGDSSEASVQQETSYSSDKAYQKILKLLNYRDRTSFELRNRLEEKGFSQVAINEALHKAIRLGFVDDARFCQIYIEQSFRAGKGKRRVENELKKKGISQQDILAQFEDSSFMEDDEEERAYLFLQKHPPRGKHIRESAFRKLAARGYSINASSQAAARYVAELVD